MRVTAKEWSDPEQGAEVLLHAVRAQPDSAVATQLQRDIEFADWWALVPPVMQGRLRTQLLHEQVDDR